MAHDVFISYSSKDKTAADAVCARLESRGVRCWIAPRDVQHGAPYGEAILDAIHGSRVMVLVLSANANASKHIPKEIERAVSRGLTILPFRIEEVLPGKSLDLFIGSVHWLDALTKPLDRHLERLADSVLKLLPELPFHQAPPPPPPPRPNYVTFAAAAAVVVVAAVLGWFLVARGDDTTDTTISNVQRAPAENAQSPMPAPGPPPANSRGAPAAQARPPASSPAGSTGNRRAAADDIVGCWRWANNVTVVIRPDGSMTAGPFTGQWQRGNGRSYTFTWPEPVDTLAMSPDGRRLTGGNQYGVPVTASRVSGGPGFPGTWTWGGVAMVMVSPTGSVTMGPFSGTWELADRSQQVYRVTWPRIQDGVTVSNDFARIQGGNQYGAAVSGVRLPGCE